MDAVLKHVLSLPSIGKQPLLIYVFWLGALAVMVLTAHFAHQKHRTSVSAQNLYDIKIIAKHSHSIYWGGIAFIILLVEALKSIC